MTAQPPPRPDNGATNTFYPWLVLIATFLTLGIGLGSTAAIGVFLPYMVRELGWTRATISAAISLFPLVNGVMQPGVGWVVGRMPALLVLAGGSGLLGVSLFLVQMTTRPWHLLISFGLLAGVGVSTTSLVVAAALMNQWFTQRRGLALGIASAGMSAGRLVLIPASGWLILWLGWRPAWGLLGTLLLVSAAGCLLLYLFQPRVQARADASGARAPTEMLAWWRHRAFWRLSAAYFACGFTVHLVSTHLPSFAVERGLTETTAALALGIAGGLAALGTVAAGWASDLMPQRHLLGVAYLIRAAGLAGLVLASHPVIFVIAGVLTAGTFLVTGNLTVSLAGNVFGANRAPMIFGFIHVGHQLAGTVAVILGGLTYDVVGSYTPVFALSAVLLVGSAAAAFGFPEQFGTRTVLPTRRASGTARL